MRRKDILALAGEMAALHDRDPFSAAWAEGVRVAFYPFRDLPGMYGTVLGIPFIAIQSGLSPMSARVICAHEMGHHFLHRPVADVGFLGESLVVGGRQSFSSRISSRLSTERFPLSSSCRISTVRTSGRGRSATRRGISSRI